MNDPLISIVLPVYNAEEYIGECLNSIVSNNLSKVEIVVVDDGSTDKSRDIIRSYKEKYPQIQLYEKKNGGVSSARNYGLKKSHGRWIWFIDSDDIIFQNSIEYIQNQIIIHNFDVFIFGYIRFNKSIDGRYKSYDESKIISDFEAIKTLLDPNYASFPWNKIIKRKILCQVQFPVEMTYTEDMAIMYKIYALATKFLFQSSALYGYRERANSLSHSSLTLNQLQNAAFSHFEMYKFLNENYPVLATEFKEDTVACVISYLHRLKYFQIKKYKELIYFLKNKIGYTNLSFRYKLEIFSFKYCYPLFKMIGITGKIKRFLIKKK